MRGLRAHARLTGAGAVFLGEVQTAPVFRLWSIEDRFPGMMRAEAGGASIAAELYAIPHAGFAAVLESEPDGLCVGRVALADGTSPLGVLAEPRLVQGREEITAHGGWRAYLRAKGIHPL
ncbi:glutamyl-tRNA amidotransferase [Roseomonas nepalensis]|uniref:Glutamyl-tRNA amidotransferase n=2 Tax=Muricoccus nepalensis TaxID=1854500 RepID=A0A502GE13_9PROT|nr:glutamyl-tRNA amidotransferase [Roseomonas nepalensis]